MFLCLILDFLTDRIQRVKVMVVDQSLLRVSLFIISVFIHRVPSGMCAFSTPVYAVSR